MYEYLQTVIHSKIYSNDQQEEREKKKIRLVVDNATIKHTNYDGKPPYYTNDVTPRNKKKDLRWVASYQIPKLPKRRTAAAASRCAEPHRKDSSSPPTAGMLLTKEEMNDILCTAQKVLYRPGGLPSRGI